MGFETPKSPLSDYLNWTTSGKLQLPDFQREYKWEDERIRSLLSGSSTRTSRLSARSVGM